MLLKGLAKLKKPWFVALGTSPLDIIWSSLVESWNGMGKEEVKGERDSIVDGQRTR